MQRLTEEKFSPELLERARGVANRYKLVLEPSAEVGLVGYTVEMPTVFGEGRTPDECVDDVRWVQTIAVALLLERGELPPLPVGDGKRDVQVNFRVTAEERFLFQNAAAQSGYRSLSDFVRAAVIDHAKRRIA